MNDRALDLLDKDLRSVFWSAPGSDDLRVAAADRRRAELAKGRGDGYEPNDDLVAEGWTALFGESS